VSRPTSQYPRPSAVKQFPAPLRCLRYLLLKFDVHCPCGSTSILDVRCFRVPPATLRRSISVVIVKGRCQAGIIADDFGVVRRVQSLLGRMEIVAHVVADGATAGQGQPIAGQEMSGVINADDAIVELVAYQRVAIAQTHRARGQRGGNAQRIGVGKILPDDVVRCVHFNDAGIAGIGEKGVAVGEAAGEGEGIDGASGGERLDDFISAGDLEGAAVALVRDQDMAVFQQLGGIWPAELVGRVGVGAGILPDDLLFEVHFNDAVVGLVGDKNVERGQESALHGGIQ
jgi:hypothetical protein